MNPTLKLLASAREARRETAISKLASATRQLEAAHAMCLQAHQALGQAVQWRQEVLAGGVLGANPQLRECMLPSCTALMGQCQEQFVQSQLKLRQAHEDVAAQRRHLVHCEQDLVRLEEWKKLEETHVRRAKTLQEDRQEEELSSRSGKRSGAAT